MFTAKKKEFEFLLNNPYAGPALSGSSVSFTSIPSRQEASKMSFGTITPVFPSSPFKTSDSLPGPTGLFSGFGGVKQYGGFSFGLGASSGTANVVTTSSSILPQSPPSFGFSFGMQSSEPEPSMHVSSPQNMFSSSAQPFLGFGQTSPNLNPIGGGSSPASHDLFGSSNPFQAANETESLQSLNQSNGRVKDLETSMTQMVTQLTNDTPAAPFSQQNEGPSGIKSDIWSKESWDLGEIPEEEPPLYAR